MHNFQNIISVAVFIFISCNGRHAAQNPAETENPVSGDTVQSLPNSVWIVFQDSNNNYWFGSDGEGVYRYDGKTMLRFSTRHGLHSNRVRGIQEDKSGNLFFSTLGGISKFDGRTFTTPPVIYGSKWKKEPGDLWFSILGKKNEQGPYRYDGKVLHKLEFPKHYMEDEFTKNFPGTGFSPYEVYTIYEDTHGNIWFGTSNFGLCRFDGKSLRWMYEKHLTLIEETGGSFGIRSIIEDKEGKFWICNTRYRYNILPDSLPDSSNTMVHYSREKGIDSVTPPNGRDRIYFQSVVKDDNDNLWMLTYDQGVWRYDGKNLVRYPVMNGEEEIKLFSIYKDRKGDLWLGTHTSGVCKFNGTGFEKFNPE